MVATPAVTIPFSKFVLLLGDGATPTEAFTAPCAFNSRALIKTKNLNEILIPDCASEDSPGWIYRDPLSLTWSITGEGLLDEDSVATWDLWFIAFVPKNIKVVITKSDSTLITYTGKAHLAGFTETANRSERLSYNIDIQGTGPLNVTGVPLEAIVGPHALADLAVAEERAAA